MLTSSTLHQRITHLPVAASGQSLAISNLEPHSLMRPFLMGSLRKEGTLDPDL